MAVARHGSDIPASALIEIASDPQGYKKKLAELDKRTEAAVEAEAKAKKQARNAESAITRLDNAQAKYAEAQQQAETALADERARLEALKDDLVGREARVAEREGRVKEVEDENTARATDLQTWSEQLTKQAAEIAAKVEEVKAVIKKIGDREKRLRDKQAKFKNRIRKLNDGLEPDADE